MPIVPMPRTLALLESYINFTSTDFGMLYEPEQYTYVGSLPDKCKLLRYIQICQSEVACPRKTCEELTNLITILFFKCPHLL